MGALVDPSRFNTSIEQENLTPKQPGYYIQKRKEEEEMKRQQEARMRSEPKTISSAPKLSTADQYSQVNRHKFRAYMGNGRWINRELGKFYIGKS